MKYPFIHLACNDHRNGVFEGKLHAVHISSGNDTLLELQCTDRPPALDIDTKLLRIKVSHQYFAIKGHTSWVGNWCWDGVSMHPKTATAFLNFIKQTKKFACDGGVVSPIDWSGVWDNEQKQFTEDMFERELAGIEVSK